MGFFEKARKVVQMGKQLAVLKGDYPEAWAAGEEAATETLQGRSDDLVRMLISGPEERIEQYRAGITEILVGEVGSGEIAVDFEVTQESLTAFAISLGMKVLDVLEAERKEGRRKDSPGEDRELGLGDPWETGEKFAQTAFDLAREESGLPKSKSEIDDFVIRVTPVWVEAAASTIGMTVGNLPAEFVADFEASFQARLAAFLTQPG